LNHLICNNNLQWIEIPQQHLQWIEIQSSNISRPNGTYIATTAKGKKKSRDPAARLIYKG
jgi:hypothetical protein